MKIKVAEYIASFLVEHGIDTVFTVTGGGAMHLNDALGHQKGLHCTYQHHEQACAIAGEAYARLENKLAAVCVTTGPGGTNAITGVVGGWLDSIPMLILSGQVRYDTTARSTGLGIRAMGDQEFDICTAVESMTKYCEMVIDKNKIRYCLEKALKLAKQGRPGPCWLDIPLNVQGAYVDTDDLYPYDGTEDEILPPKPEKALYLDILEKIRNAERPVLNAGAGIRLSGVYEQFRLLADKLNIPVVTGWDSIDLIEDAHPLYTGRAGIMGDRAGNFAIQNSDLLLSIGSRLSIRQVKFANAKDVFFIGRGIDYAICLEGSLKMKEISYVHSEAYAAGELKHGTISLIEDGVLVIGVATQPALYEKLISNMVEVQSRGAYLMGLTTYGSYDLEDTANFTVYVPKTDSHFTTSVGIVALQLLGYYLAVARGLDVDKPRNLAKSVTVE